MDESCKPDSLMEIRNIIQKVEKKKKQREIIEKMANDEKYQIHIQELKEAMKYCESNSASFSSEFDDEIYDEVFPSHYSK